MPNNNELNRLEANLTRLMQLKDELQLKNEELDRIFKRRTEIHEGAPAKEGEVAELDSKFLKCKDDIKQIEDGVNEIQASLDNILENLQGQQ